MATTHGSPFADQLSLVGERLEMPTWEDFLALAAQLRAGRLIPFSIERHSDRDAGMEFEYSGGTFAIVGAEDSRERGTFGFCYLDPTKSDKPVQVGADVYPKYCTTSDIELTITIARTYFQVGDLERSVCWHVARAGLGRELARIPRSEILRADRPETSLEDFLSRL